MMRKRRQGTLAGPLSSAVFASAENISEGYSSVESQKLPVLAVTSKTRLPIVPDAPTLMELGYKTMRRNPATPDVRHGEVLEKSRVIAQRESA